MADSPGELPAGRLPRWVKVLGIAVAVLVVALVVLRATGVAGEHGPGGHLPGGGPSAEHSRSGHS